MPLFAVYLYGISKLVGFQGIVNVAVIAIDIPAGIFIDQVLGFIQSEGLLKEFYKQVFGKAGGVYCLVNRLVVIGGYFLLPVNYY